MLRTRLQAPATSECPCCGYRGPGFRAVDAVGAVLYNCECPACGAFERQRLLAQVWPRIVPELAPGDRVLHLAPEPQLAALMMRRPGTYTAADLMPDKLRPLRAPKFRTDLRHLALPDDACRLIVCIHVLEHIEHHRASARELYRVLHPEGLLLLMVPLGLHLRQTVEWGEANPRMFGHWRDYAPSDTAPRWAPFSVETLRPADLLDAGERARYGIHPADFIYLCRKQRQGRS